MRFFKIKLTALSFLSCLAVSAQTKEEIVEIQKETNVDALLQMSKTFDATYGAKRKRAIAYAKQRGWPITVETPDGVAKDLVGLTSDMKPIYLQSLNAGGAKTIGADKLYTGGSLGLNVNGESMTGVIFDFGAIRVTHEAFEGRGMNMETMFPNDHSSFVAGNIFASGQYQSGKARGIAPKANVHSYYRGSAITVAPTLAGNGMLASNHAYYSSYGANYIQDVRDWDAIMFNAPYYLSVWSCGNERAAAVDQITNEATTKNGISVAAVYQIDNYVDPTSVIAMHGIPTSTWGTSPGPSDDGRIKPDISAKGSGVFSTTGVNDHAYANGSGTSYASPAVVGSILLLQQHYTNINSRFMRGATVKALIAGSAKEAGPSPGPDVLFGWGLMDTEKAANTITQNGGKSLISEDKILDGFAYSREIVADGSEPLVVTISWTDPPGYFTSESNDTTSVLVNDLDLRITANGTAYYPWKLDLSNGKISAQGPAVKGNNDRDNVEKIEIPSPVPGQVYTLTVNHKRTLDSVGQRFSVVATGLKECVANRNISSPVNSFGTVTEQASSGITLSNSLDSLSQAIYHAGDEVVMANGFTAEAGSQYRAYVEGCSNDYAARLRPVERPVVTYPMPISEENATELPENAVYPNPGTGIFRVKLSGIPSGKVEVVAGDGKAIFGKSFKDQAEMEVDIKNSTPGIYILRVVSDQKVLTKKIVKK